MYVDVDALKAMSGHLDEIKASLKDAAGDVNRYDRRLGSSRIEDALDEFVEGWRDGRQKILEGIDGLHDRIRMAIDAYLKQEDALAKAARGEQ